MNRVKRLWRWFLARFRLDLDAVCEMSVGLSPHADYHDYPDDPIGEPWHFVSHKCKRCGKEFFI